MPHICEAFFVAWTVSEQTALLASGRERLFCIERMRDRKVPATVVESPAQTRSPIEIFLSIAKRISNWGTDPVRIESNLQEDYPRR